MLKKLEIALANNFLLVEIVENETHKGSDYIIMGIKIKEAVCALSSSGFLRLLLKVIRPHKETCRGDRAKMNS